MFDFLRKGATSLLAKIFLAVIIIVFIFWGIGTFTSEKKDWVAKVDGITISSKEFQEYYQFQTFQLKQTFGELSSEELKKLKIKEQVLENLIKMKLLEREAEKVGIKITSPEVGLAISQFPLFREANQFDPNKYHSVLRSLGISPSFFEKLVKFDLLEKKLTLILTTPLLVSSKEAEEFLNYSHQTLVLEELSLPLSKCKVWVNYSEKDLENYFLTHRNLYVEEEKVKLALYLLPYQREVKLEPEEIKKYYQENLERFKQPFKIKLRRITVSGADEKALLEAQKTRDQIKGLKDFEKFGIKKGDWFEEQALPEEIRNLLKKAQTGEIVGPVKIGTNYFILGVEEVKPERVLSLKEIESEIRKELISEKIKNLTKSKAHSLYQEIIKENGLTNWAKKTQVQLVETDFLGKEGVKKILGSSEGILKVFQSNKGDFLSPLEVPPKGIVFVEIIDKKPPKNLSFEEAKGRVKEDYLNIKGKEICENKIKKFTSNQSLSLRAEEIKKEGFQIRTYRVLRKEIGKLFSPTFSKEIFSMGSKGFIKDPFWDGEEIKIFMIKEIYPFEKKTYLSEELELTVSNLLEEKRRVFFNQWYQELRKKAQVKVSPDFEKW
ncbi:MAG: SurA N-terminal domain-containing protein [Thermodesulfobacteriaceae bacterium]|nr:SurA N-terminal domain-containing protein [Thermodesulfobacteriaceae bacterium]MCX8042010.1 SurA N-terminal domain-containing protein [Thermodesulfobacteriaceae bacterium]MDW8136426.1 SurA N-terminal domain-containing protein [Thermodesulfobacterium sp.]